MQRRTFLQAAALSALGLAGCRSMGNADLRLTLLEQALPNAVIRRFQQDRTGQMVLDSAPSAAALFTALQQAQQNTASRPASDLSSLGDYWLTAAIQQDLVQPFAVDELADWGTLAPPWPELVQRQPSTGQLAAYGPVWGVPYRWGGLVIAYDRQQFADRAWRPQGWADLLHPSLSRQVVLPDHPRLVLGLALKGVGASANVADPAAVADLPAFLERLAPNVRTYDSQYPLETLITGGAALVVGWSLDVLSALEAYSIYEVVVPQEGTLLSADLWVRPRAAQTEALETGAAHETSDPLGELGDLGQQWLAYCLGETFAQELLDFGDQLSPRWLGTPASDRHLLLQHPAALAVSEFLHPLSAEAEGRYLDLWRELRGG